MFGKLFIGALAALALSAPASAAEMTSSYDTKMVDWTGFYGGVWTGYRLGRNINTFCGPGGICLGTVPLSGLVGGIDVGYDKQLSNGVVVGGHIMLPFIKPTQTNPFPALGAGATFTANPQFAIAAGARIGKAMDNGLLPYFTAGLAMANVTVTDDLGTSSNANHFGGYLGAGLEMMVNESWSIDTRYSLGLLGEGQYSFCAAAACTSRYVDVSHNFTIGVHYRFD